MQRTPNIITTEEDPWRTPYMLSCVLDSVGLQVEPLSVERSMMPPVPTAINSTPSKELTPFSTGASALRFELIRVQLENGVDVALVDLYIEVPLPTATTTPCLLANTELRRNPLLVKIFVQH